MKVTIKKTACSIFYALVASGGVHIAIVESYPGELVYGCVPAEKEWEGKYTPWDGHTKNAHAHLTFDDGPFVGITDTILDVLKEYNTTATFFLVSDNLNEDTRYLVDRMINEVCNCFFQCPTLIHDAVFESQTLCMYIVTST